MPEQHAFLSASSADKWINCPPSAAAEAKIQDLAGQSAAEGTLAHAIAAVKAEYELLGGNKKMYSDSLKPLLADELHDKDMDRLTDEYVEELKRIALTYGSRPFILIEKRCDYSHIAPEGYGTADCLMLGGDTLHVIDFKYGKAVRVDAPHNPQLLLYAAGAVKTYQVLYGIKRICLHIIQPRMNNISEWSLSRKELDIWCEEIKEIAGKAFAGEGDRKAGEWCDSLFCKCRPTCRAYIEQMDAVKPYINKPADELNHDEVGKALTLAANIKKWYSILEKYAMNELLSGRGITGWKIVEGRSNRAFDDIDAAYKDLQATGVAKETLYRYVPITLTECEKMLGGKDFAELCGSHVIKPPGKPTLVPESDKRPSFNPAAADFEGI